MAQEEDKHSLEAKFAAAVQVIRSLPEEGPFQPSDDMMLMLYSYYKQATLGPCNIPRPNGFWDTRGKAKWDSWSSLGNMTEEEAMKSYVENIQLILETIPMSDEVSDLVQKLGTFYTETVEDEENEVDRRPFTRPFAQHRDELIRTFKKPTMEGYGDLWDDIQNVQDISKDSSVVHSVSGGSEDAKGGRENSEVEVKEESSGDWRRSEEEDENGDEEDNTDDGDDEEEEEEEEDKVWSPDPRLLTVGPRRWRADTLGSCSSMEPSVTHSSLNSELEEEELACSIEPSVQENTYMHFNGHLHGLCDTVLENNHKSTESDNEEFCDSMEHLAMEEGTSTSKPRSTGSGCGSVRQADLWLEGTTPQTGGEDHMPMGDSHSTSLHTSSLSRRGKGSRSPRVSRGSVRGASVADAACLCVSRSGRRPAGVAGGGNVDEQIATALLRLQHDMAAVLHRLHALEALTQSRSASPRQEDSLVVVQKFLRPSWWPFDCCPLTVALTALWPLIAQWLVQVYLQRKRRKIP